MQEPIGETVGSPDESPTRIERDARKVRSLALMDDAEIEKLMQTEKTSFTQLHTVARHTYRLELKITRLLTLLKKLGIEANEELGLHPGEADDD